MPKYGCHVTNFTTATTSTTIIRIQSVSNRRCELVEVIMTGAGATTPADVGHDCQVAIGNANLGGVGIAAPNAAIPFVGSSAASSASLAIRYTNEPSPYNLLYPVYFGFNQRGGQRWSVPQGEGVKADSGTAASAQAAIRNQSSAAGNVNTSGNWWED